MGDADSCRVVLIGMMGSGKTTIGRLLSRRTGWPLRDNDDLLLRLLGVTARELLAARGEDALRSAEEQALAAGLAGGGPFIVTAAAGTILSEASRAALEGPTVVWLRARPETLSARAAAADHRPWLDHGDEWFAAAAAARGPLYESVADLIVDIEGRSADDIASELYGRVREICEGLAERAPPG